MKLFKSAIPLIFSGVAMFSGQGWSAPIAVANFSFELPPSTNGGTGCPITGWTCSQNDTQMGVYVPGAAQYLNNGTNGLPAGSRVPDGTQAGYIQLGNAMFSQNTSATIADNTLYRLDVFVGHRLDFPFPVPGGTFGLTHNGTAIPGATFNITDPGLGNWLNEFVTFATTTGAGDPFQGQTLGIFLRDGGASGQINFDNVRLSATPSATGVPEPGSLALIGIAVGAFAFSRRRKTA